MEERKAEIKEIIGDLLGMPEGHYARMRFSAQYREYCQQIDECNRPRQLEIKFNTIKNDILK